MTEQEQLHVRAELARRMGITIEKRWQHVADPTWYLYDVRLPGGTYLGSHCASIEEAASKLPDPFTSAADKDALVKWLAADDARWKQFDDKLLMALSLQPLPAYDNSNPGFQRMMRRQIFTAPLETVTLAAAKALGIAEVGERA